MERFNMVGDLEIESTSAGHVRSHGIVAHRL